MPKDRLDEDVPTTLELETVRQSAEEAPSIPVLLKSTNWDRRLAEARERRQAVLAAKDGSGGNGADEEASEARAEPGTAKNWRASALVAFGAVLGATGAAGVLSGGGTSEPAAPAVFASVISPVPGTRGLGADFDPSVPAISAPPQVPLISPARLATVASDTPPFLWLSGTRRAPRASIWTSMNDGLGTPSVGSDIDRAMSSWTKPVRDVDAMALLTPNGADAPVLAGYAQEAAPNLAELRLVIFAPAALDERDVAPTLDALADLGVAAADANRVPVTIRENQVRLYHASDRDAAARVADATGAELRDFTEFQPRPPLGTVELWFAGQSGVTRPLSVPPTPRATGRPAAVDVTDLVQSVGEVTRAVFLQDAVPARQRIRQAGEGSPERRHERSAHKDGASGGAAHKLN
ncbi:MAG: hypothetical protein AAGB18_02415 [Pseudomonadota bacterium]